MSKSLTNGKAMTIKEIALVLKKDESTIRKIGKDLFPNSFRNGIQTSLNEFQVTAIKTNLGKNSELPKTELEETLIIVQAQKILEARLKRAEEAEQIQREKAENLMIELDQEKSWYSVKRVQLLGHLEGVNPKTIWRPLKKWCIQNNQQIREIFDANYGTVKTYHASAWEAVYGIDFTKALIGEGAAL